MDHTDHILKKIADLQDRVRAGSITGIDMLSRLDYIADCVEEMRS